MAHRPPIPVVHVVEFVEDNREDIIQIPAFLTIVKHVSENLRRHHRNLIAIRHEQWD